ncbi:MAG: flavin-containing monooxygenase [Longimicrobiales bacterium]
MADTLDLLAVSAATRTSSRSERIIGRRDATAVVIGAGPAGLATARELAARDVAYRLFERGPDIGHVWRNLYDSLRLHTGKHLSALPGLRFPAATPLFPAKSDFVDYLEHYRAAFGIHAETGVDVKAAQPGTDGAGWVLETNCGPVAANALVVATGIVSNPVIPDFPDRDRFRGEVIHSAEYRRPDIYGRRRLLVVGCGNSGGEIASELASAGAQVTIAVRSGANVVPLTILGIPIQYISFLIRKLPRSAQDVIVGIVRTLTDLRRGPPVLPRPAYSPLDAIPLIGFQLVDAIRAGRIRVRPGIQAFTESGIRFEDGEQQQFDSVILATGFRPALEPLNGLIRTDARGFAVRTDRVTSADQRRLWFVGHNYSATGGLQNIATDAALAADRVAQSR